MFYKEKRDKFWWFKSDKDNFFFGPFDKIADEDLMKIKCKNFKTWKNIAGIWQKKFFCFEYTSSGLFLSLFDVILNGESKNVNFFILISVDDIVFVDEKKLDFLADFGEKTYIHKIYGWNVKLSKKDFIKILPLLNGFVNKYAFLLNVISEYDAVINLTSIYDLSVSDEEILKLGKDIKKIKQFVQSDNLLTFSKIKQFQENLNQNIFNLVKIVIKLYYLALESIEDKKQLKKLINTVEPEFKAQAILLEKTGQVNLELFVNRIKFLLSQIDEVIEIIKLFKKTYLK